MQKSQSPLSCCRHRTCSIRKHNAELLAQRFHALLCVSRPQHVIKSAFPCLLMRTFQESHHFRAFSHNPTGKAIFAIERFKTDFVLLNMVIRPNRNAFCFPKFSQVSKVNAHPQKGSGACHCHSVLVNIQIFLTMLTGFVLKK